MGRNRGREGPGGGSSSWADSERTMAAAEEDARTEIPGDTGGTLCACGSKTFILEAFLEVEEGVLKPEPVEVEALTCPECGREYEAVVTSGGKVLRGDFLGYFEEDEP